MDADQAVSQLDNVAPQEDLSLEKNVFFVEEIKELKESYVSTIVKLMKIGSVKTAFADLDIQEILKDNANGLVDLMNNGLVNVSAKKTAEKSMDNADYAQLTQLQLMNDANVLKTIIGTVVPKPATISLHAHSTLNF